MTYTFDENIVSDLHKDAYGFRPSQGWWSMWAAFNPDQKQAMWDSLIDAMDAAIEMEKEQQAQALVEFRKTLKSTMSLCNVDWKNALRILMEADQIDMDNPQDFDYFLWQYDLSFEKRKEIFDKYFQKESIAA